MTEPTIDPTSAAHRFLSGCVQAGMEHVVLSPGSRSTPITVAAASVDGLDHSLHIDERTAAFAALGRARATGAPVGLVCTSGTAAANHLPAVAEARQARVPLVILTADRPPEHQDWGVGQTFDQTHLFGTHAVEFVEMPVGGDGGLGHALRAGWRATATASDAPGPVHVNWPFRLPLEPTGAPFAPAPELPRPARAIRRLHPADAERARSILAERRGLIVAGPYAARPFDDEARSSILELARRTGWPILADVLSGLRGEGHEAIVDAADRVVGRVPEDLRPDVVFRIGDTPTAKSIRLWWESFEAHHVLLDPLDRWQDPSHRGSDRLPVAAAALIDLAPIEAADAAWSAAWVELGRATRRIVDGVVAGFDAPAEAVVASTISRHEPRSRPVVVSSSMPIRDLDSFGQVDDPRPVHANRGINGIDGVIATAIGVAGALDTRVIVHIGDVALLHDIGSLLDAARSGLDLTLVVPNNDGGGIFSFLPIRRALDDATYDALFHTPHGTDFGFLAAHRNIHHEVVADHDLADALTRAEARPGVSILDVPLTTADALDLHAAIADAVRGGT